jgi:hypothetical protein
MLLGTVAVATAATAQPAPPPVSTTRTVIAATKLATVAEVPLYFRAIDVALPPGEQSSFSAVSGVIYQLSRLRCQSINRQEY